jgi:hypothetical protein
MNPSSYSNTKNQKKRGRPKKAEEVLARSIRLTEDIWSRIDDWRREQPDLPSRSEALRRYLDETLPPRRRPLMKTEWRGE